MNFRFSSDLCFKNTHIYEIPTLFTASNYLWRKIISLQRLFVRMLAIIKSCDSKFQWNVFETYLWSTHQLYSVLMRFTENITKPIKSFFWKYMYLNWAKHLTRKVCQNFSEFFFKETWSKHGLCVQELGYYFIYVLSLIP